jgi:hypothetical protein
VITSTSAGRAVTASPEPSNTATRTNQNASGRRVGQVPSW